jgi:hypothetical protein
VVGHPDPRPVLHAREPAHAAPPPRLRAALGRHRAEGVHRPLLPRPDRRLLAPRGGRARRRGGGGGRRRPDLGPRLPRPDGGRGAAAAAPPPPPEARPSPRSGCGRPGASTTSRAPSPTSASSAPSRRRATTAPLTSSTAASTASPS